MIPSRQEALERYFDVTRELSSLHRELAEILIAEKDGRIRSYMASDETSVTGRERVADFHVLNLSLDVLKIKGEIAALNEEKEALYLLLMYGG